VQINGDIRPMQFVMYGRYLQYKSVLNPFGWHDQTTDSLFRQAMRSANPTPLLQQVSARAVTEGFFVPIWETQKMWFVSKRVTGVAMSYRAIVPWASEWSPAS
jgi:hypothetical protein